MRKGLYGQWGGEPEKSAIALIGMMGSGKDSLAGELAALIGKDAIDLDKKVESRAGKGISRIFAEEGEAAFRKLEEEELLRALREGGIINCGGGAIIGERGREEIKNRALVIWLWADPETLASRVKQGDARPLLEGGDPKERLESILKERMRLYAEACDIVISTGRCSPKQAAGRLLYEIR